MEQQTYHRPGALASPVGLVHQPQLVLIQPRVDLVHQVDSQAAQTWGQSVQAT